MPRPQRQRWRRGDLIPPCRRPRAAPPACATACERHGLPSLWRSANSRSRAGSPKPSHDLRYGPARPPRPALAGSKGASRPPRPRTGSVPETIHPRVGRPRSAPPLVPVLSRRREASMTHTTDLFMGTESQGPRERLAAFLGRKFPRSDGYSQKRLERAIDCTPKTAENLLNGHWPAAHHLQRIVILFGRDVIDAVFGPDIDGTLDRLKQEEVRLEQALLETRARRLSVEGAGARADQRLEAAADGSVVDLPREGRSFASARKRT